MVTEGRYDENRDVYSESVISTVTAISAAICMNAVEVRGPFPQTSFMSIASILRSYRTISRPVRSPGHRYFPTGFLRFPGVIGSRKISPHDDNCD